MALLCGFATAGTPDIAKTDPVAENMLLLQTASGGWSKHYREKKVDYTQAFDAAERDALRAPGRHDDATIDNKATTSEIAYLLRAHAGTGNPAYLAAAGRGVDYLLKAQYPNGGWPQYYPDRSLYRHQVTYNDDAMVRVISLLQAIADGDDDVSALTPTHGTRARAAAVRGIDCILATQVVIDGKPTIWAAQYDEATMKPAKARAYELPSLAVAESVGVVRLLMRQPRRTRGSSPRSKRRRHGCRRTACPTWRWSMSLRPPRRPARTCAWSPGRARRCGRASTTCRRSSRCSSTATASRFRSRGCPTNAASVTRGTAPGRNRCWRRSCRAGVRGARRTERATTIHSCLIRLPPLHVPGLD